MRQPGTHAFNDTDDHNTDTHHRRGIWQNVMREIIGIRITVFHQTFKHK